MDRLTPAALIIEAASAGLRVRAEGDRLIIQGPRRAASYAQVLIARKAEVLATLAALDFEIAWRAEVMARQVPPHGPILALAARPDLPAIPGHCRSCGDPLPADHRSWVPHCPHCVLAMRLAISAVAESA